MSDAHQTSRRAVLAGLSATLLLGAGASRSAAAAEPAPPLFILLVLRGGLDGLAMVAPYGDPAYRSARGKLAASAPGVGDDALLDLDGFYGLHPAMAPLHGMFTAGELLAVHAAALPYDARSHFDAQDLLENGTTRPKGARDGWLNRALPAVGLPATAIGGGVPLVLRGPQSVGSLDPGREPDADAHFFATMGRLYADDPRLAGPFAEALKARDLMVAEGGRQGRRGGLRSATVRGLAQLLVADRGPRIAVLEAGGWDTHAQQRIRLGRQLGGLADGLVTFREALGPAWSRTVVLAVTEFGRTVRPNGTGGTDHGTAGVALLIGGAVAGGRVLGTWPGLHQGALHEGRDLAATTDLRSVFKGVMRDHLALDEATLGGVVFPGSGGVAPLDGLLRA